MPPTNLTPACTCISQKQDSPGRELSRGVGLDGATCLGWLGKTRAATASRAKGISLELRLVRRDGSYLLANGTHTSIRELCSLSCYNIRGAGELRSIDDGE